ncbi:MAG: hypothetical protein Sapg2KO_46080 [Saprospiraceae bacterium]
MSNSRKHILLKITNQGVYYNPRAYLSWEDTNFPPKTDFNFNDRVDIFWEVVLLDFDKKDKTLSLTVVDYEANYSKQQFETQQPKFLFRKIAFKNLKWQALEKILNIYRRHQFSNISDANPLQDQTLASETEAKIESFPNRKIDFKVSHSLKKIRFQLGYVELEKKIKGLREKVTLVIEHPHILPEFEPIKSYFAKVIGKKTIEITGTITINSDGSIDANAHSEEIKQINEDSITAVKRLKLWNSISKPTIKTVDKSLFTSDEFFDTEEDTLLGNTYRKKEKELLEDILGFEQIRNRKQLQYLSGKLQSTLTGMKFTLSPKFGFLFHVQGEEMDHFIWELLNTNATYIWSMERAGITLEKKLILVEKQINLIRDKGRMIYLQSEKPSGFIFSKTNHESAASAFKDSFPKWRQRINEKLV